MADVMTCPLCGQEHPVGTTWCPQQWATIPSTPPDPPTADPELAADPVADALPPAPDLPAAAVETTCPSCGDHGLAGTSCRQCGATLPAAETDTPRTAWLVLPSGERVAIGCGQEIVVGRTSDVDQVRLGLEPFDGVSRRHCYVTVDPVRGTVTVRDPGSTNHTWVGDDPREVGPDERRTVALPARLRLGKHLSVTVVSGGDDE